MFSRDQGNRTRGTKNKPKNRTGKQTLDLLAEALIEALVSFTCPISQFEIAHTLFPGNAVIMLCVFRGKGELIDSENAMQNHTCK